jgi:hypothetical protein
MSELVCRQIESGDIDGIIDLLTRGFKRPRGFWQRALTRLSQHEPPDSYPRFGYMIADGARPVGVLLLIFSRINGAVYCSVSSWYCDPEYRYAASMLISRSVRFKDIIYTNITPDHATWKILAATGYQRYCDGHFFTLPLLARSWVGKARSFTGTEDLPAEERQLLLDHAGYGCITVLCDGVPFVFLLGCERERIRCATLAYCRSIDDFVRYAGSLGLYLAKRGVFLVAVDANQRIPGLIGLYLGNAPKFYRGPTPPRLGNLAYTERAMFTF